MLIPVRPQHIELCAPRRVQQPVPAAEVFHDRSSHPDQTAPDLPASIQVGRRWQHHRPHASLLIEDGLDIGRFLQQRQELLPGIGARSASPCLGRLPGLCLLIAGYLGHLGLQAVWPARRAKIRNALFQLETVRCLARSCSGSPDWCLQ